MQYDDLLILISSHSLEDFPSDLGEPEASSLLNAFAATWHPHLLANAKLIPRWHRADNPPDELQKRLIVVPTHCEGWLPYDWSQRITDAGSVVIKGQSDRDPIITQALAPLGELSPVSADLVADFYALGLAHLFIELLTRKMRNYSSLDLEQLRRDAVTAAEAAVAGRNDDSRAHLKECFELLLEGRNRFYPVDCFLIDLCLVIPRLSGAELRSTLQIQQPLNLLISGRDVEEVAEKHPETISTLRSGIDDGRVAIVGGDLFEQPLSLMSVNSTIWQLLESQRITQEKTGQPARVWGRRRFGLFPQWPQILKKSGFTGALHVVLDDGFYPDHEYSKFRWQGVENSSIEALSRIPSAADAATSFLRFPTRMAESMDNDHTAAVIFARWPDVQTPFFDDFRRIANYAPVLGRFVTLSHFFEQTGAATTTGSYPSREYLTPFLFQAVAREEKNPISRIAELVSRRQRLDRALWLHRLQALLYARPLQTPALSDLEKTSETLPEDATPEAVSAQNTAIEALTQAGADGLARMIMSGGGDRNGYLLINTLSFSRTVAVDLDWHGPKPIPSGDQVRVQWSERHAQLIATLPGSGFLWIAAEETNPTEPGKVSLAEANLLRNDFFEVHISEETGGISKIKGHGRSPNRLSQQLNFRFSRERTFTVGTGDQAEQIRSHYAQMKLRNTEVTANGPALGEIVSVGEILDQEKGDRLAEYRQTVRVWRGRPVVELIIDLTIDRMPDAEPWHNYFTSRFAWHDETAALSYSAQSGVQGCADERIESPYFVEIATPEARTTIVSHGLAFHRKTGPRMLDSILVVPGESQRRFRFLIAVDQNYPMQVALDALTPPVVVSTRTGPPKSSSTGWFFQLDPPNVQLLGIFPPTPAEPSGEDGPTPSQRRCIVRLLETEGRPARVRLRSLWNPREARQVDLEGRTLAPMRIDGDSSFIDLTSYEIADIELSF